MQSIVKSLLDKLLGKYIEKLDDEKININLWNSTFSLQNLVFKADAFDFLNLPFVLKSGFIGNFELKLDLKNIWTNAISVSIKDIDIILKEKVDFKPKKVEEKENDVESKKTLANAWESLFITSKNYKIKPKECSFLENIIDNVEIKIINLHIGLMLNDIAFGISTEQISVEKDRNVSSDIKPHFICKKMRIVNALGYLNKDSNFNFDDFSKNGKINYVLNCLMVQIGLKINKNPRTNSFKFPKIEATTEIGNFNTSIQSDNFKQIMQIIDFIDKFLKLQEFYKEKPKVSVKENPKVWWMYLANIFSGKMIFKKNELLTFKSIKKFVLDREKYIENYIKIFKNDFFDDFDEKSKEIIDKIESEYSLEKIIFFRKLTINRLIYLTDSKTLIEKGKKEKSLFNFFWESKKRSVKKIPKEILREIYKESFLLTDIQGNFDQIDYPNHFVSFKLSFLVDMIQFSLRNKMMEEQFTIKTDLLSQFVYRKKSFDLFLKMKDFKIFENFTSGRDELVSKHNPKSDKWLIDGTYRNNPIDLNTQHAIKFRFEPIDIYFSINLFLSLENFFDINEKEVNILDQASFYAMEYVYELQNNKNLISLLKGESGLYLDIKLSAPVLHFSITDIGETLIINFGKISVDSDPKNLIKQREKIYAVDVERILNSESVENNVFQIYNRYLVEIDQLSLKSNKVDNYLLCPLKIAVEIFHIKGKKKIEIKTILKLTASEIQINFSRDIFISTCSYFQKLAFARLEKLSKHWKNSNLSKSNVFSGKLSKSEKNKEIVEIKGEIVEKNEIVETVIISEDNSKMAFKFNINQFLLRILNKAQAEIDGTFFLINQISAVLKTGVETNVSFSFKSFYSEYDLGLENKAKLIELNSENEKQCLKAKLSLNSGENIGIESKIETLSLNIDQKRFLNFLDYLLLTFDLFAEIFTTAHTENSSILTNENQSEKSKKLICDIFIKNLSASFYENSIELINVTLQRISTKLKLIGNNLDVELLSQQIIINDITSTCQEGKIVIKPLKPSKNSIENSIENSTENSIKKFDQRILIKFNKTDNKSNVSINLEKLYFLFLKRQIDMLISVSIKGPIYKRFFDQNLTKNDQNLTKTEQNMTKNDEFSNDTFLVISLSNCQLKLPQSSKFENKLNLVIVKLVAELKNGVKVDFFNDVLDLEFNPYFDLSRKESIDFVKERTEIETFKGEMNRLKITAAEINISEKENVFFSLILYFDNFLSHIGFEVQKLTMTCSFEKIFILRKILEFNLSETYQSIETAKIEPAITPNKLYVKITLKQSNFLILNFIDDSKTDIQIFVLCVKFFAHKEQRLEIKIDILKVRDISNNNENLDFHKLISFKSFFFEYKTKLKAIFINLYCDRQIATLSNVAVNYIKKCIEINAEINKEKSENSLQNQTAEKNLQIENLSLRIKNCKFTIFEKYGLKEFSFLGNFEIKGLYQIIFNKSYVNFEITKIEVFEGLVIDSRDLNKLLNVLKCDYICSEFIEISQNFRNFLPRRVASINGGKLTTKMSKKGLELIKYVSNMFLLKEELDETKELVAENDLFFRNEGLRLYSKKEKVLEFFSEIDLEIYFSKIKFQLCSLKTRNKMRIILPIMIANLDNFFIQGYSFSFLRKALLKFLFELKFCNSKNEMKEYLIEPCKFVCQLNENDILKNLFIATRDIINVNLTSQSIRQIQNALNFNSEEEFNISMNLLKTTEISFINNTEIDVKFSTPFEDFVTKKWQKNKFILIKEINFFDLLFIEYENHPIKNIRLNETAKTYHYIINSISNIYPVNNTENEFLKDNKNEKNEKNEKIEKNKKMTKKTAAQTAKKMAMKKAEKLKSSSILIKNKSSRKKLDLLVNKNILNREKKPVEKLSNFLIFLNIDHSQRHSEIIVHSGVLIENQTKKSFFIFDKKIESKSKCYLPLIYYGRKYLNIAIADIQDAGKYFFNKKIPINKDKNYNLTIKCLNSETDNVYNFVINYKYDNKNKTKSIEISSWIKIINTLPLPIRIKISSKIKSNSFDIEKGEFKDFSQLDNDAKLTLEITKFTLKSSIPIQNILKNVDHKENIIRIKMKTPNKSKNGKMVLFLSFFENDGIVFIKIFVHYWIFDFTNHDLQFSDNPDRKRINNYITPKFSSRTSVAFRLFELHKTSKYLFIKSKNGTEWSKPLNINIVETFDYVKEIVKNENGFEFLETVYKTNFGKEAYFNTRIIKFFPKFIIKNNLPFPLLLYVKNGNSVKIASNETIVPNFCFKSKEKVPKSRKISLKIAENDYTASYFFKVDEVGENDIKLFNPKNIQDIKILTTSVTFVNGSFRTIIKAKNKDLFNYKIENKTFTSSIEVCQKKSGTWTTIKKNESHFFIWESKKNRILTIRIKELQENQCELKFEKKQHCKLPVMSRDLFVHFFVVSEGFVLKLIASEFEKNHLSKSLNIIPTNQNLNTFLNLKYHFKDQISMICNNVSDKNKSKITRKSIEMAEKSSIHAWEIAINFISIEGSKLKNLHCKILLAKKHYKLAGSRRNIWNRVIRTTIFSINQKVKVKVYKNVNKVGVLSFSLEKFGINKNGTSRLRLPFHLVNLNNAILNVELKVEGGLKNIHNVMNEIALINRKLSEMNEKSERMRYRTFKYDMRVEIMENVNFDEKETVKLMYVKYGEKCTKTKLTKETKFFNLTFKEQKFQNNFKLKNKKKGIKIGKIKLNIEKNRKNVKNSEISEISEISQNSNKNNEKDNEKMIIFTLISNGVVFENSAKIDILLSESLKEKKNISGVWLKLKRQAENFPKNVNFFKNNIGFLKNSADFVKNSDFLGEPKIFISLKQKEITREIEKANSAVSLALKGFGISLINKAFREIIYLSLQEISANLKDFDNKQTFECEMANFQVDVQIDDVTEEMLISETPQLKTEIKPFLRLSAIKEKLAESLTPRLFLRYFSVLIQELDIKVEEKLIFYLFKFGVEVLKELEFFAIKHQPVEFERNFIFDELINPLFIKVSFLQINPLALNISVKLSTPSHIKNLLQDSLLSKVLGSVVYGIRSVELVPIRLKSLIVENAEGTFHNLLLPIVMHYKTQSIYQIYKVVGSLDIIGNPVFLVKNIGDGVFSLFYFPAKGFTKSPEEFATGIKKGGIHFVSSSLTGVFGSVSKLSKKIASGISVISFDKEYQKELSSSKKSANIGQGLLRGTAGLGKGIFKGVTGIFTNPVKGVETEGAKGFFKGVGTGMVGAFSKPIAGVFDFLGSTFEGISNTSNAILRKSNPLEKVRPPRVLQSNKITCYNKKDAVAQFAMNKLPFCNTVTKSNLGDFEGNSSNLPKEKFQRYFSLNEVKKGIIISNKRIVVLNLKNGKLNLEKIKQKQSNFDSIPLNSISKIKISKSPNGVILSSNEKFLAEKTKKTAKKGKLLIKCQNLTESLWLEKIVKKWLDKYFPYIVSAKYGGGSVWIDVTNTLREIVEKKKTNQLLENSFKNIFLFLVDSQTENLENVLVIVFKEKDVLNQKIFFDGEPILFE